MFTGSKVIFGRDESTALLNALKIFHYRVGGAPQRLFRSEGTILRL